MRTKMAKVVDFKKKSEVSDTKSVFKAVFQTLYDEGRLIPIYFGEIENINLVPENTDNHPPFFYYFNKSNGFHVIGCNEKLIYEMSNLEAKKRKINLSEEEKNWIKIRLMESLAMTIHAKKTQLTQDDREELERINHYIENLLNEEKPEAEMLYFCGMFLLSLSRQFGMELPD